MKNFTINGYTKSPLGELTKNQIMMCIVENGEANALLVKTDTDYYGIPMDSITEEEFNEFFVIKEEVVSESFHAVFNIIPGKLHLILPIILNGQTITVDWGDGTIDNSTGHFYETSGVYDVKIDGLIDYWNYNGLSGSPSTSRQESLIEIKNWGSNFIITENTSFATSNNLNLNNVIGLPTITTTNFTNFFLSCSSLTSVNNINNWDTSSVENMENMFRNSFAFNQPLSFNTSNVTNMSNVFSGCSELNSTINFNTSNVTNMVDMFGGCVVFNQPLNFNTSNVTDMSSMFRETYTFNQPLSFNTSNVTNMSRMFSYCMAFNQNLSNWDVTKVTNIEDFDLETPSWELPKPNFI